MIMMMRYRSPKKRKLPGLPIIPILVALGALIGCAPPSSIPEMGAAFAPGAEQR